MKPHPLARIATSSTAWFGGIVAAISAFASSTQFAMPPWLATAMVVAFGLKEAASKIGAAIPTIAPTVPPTSREVQP